MQQALYRSGAADAEPGSVGAEYGPCSERHADRGTVAGEVPLVRTWAHLRAAGRALSNSSGQDDATGAVHALPQLPAERLGAAAQVRRRWLSRGRQGDV